MLCSFHLMDIFYIVLSICLYLCDCVCVCVSVTPLTYLIPLIATDSPPHPTSCSGH